MLREALSGKTVESMGWLPSIGVTMGVLLSVLGNFVMVVMIVFLSLVLVLVIVLSLFVMMVIMLVFHRGLVMVMLVFQRGMVVVVLMRVLMMVVLGCIITREEVVAFKMIGPSCLVLSRVVGFKLPCRDASSQNRDNEGVENAHLDVRILSLCKDQSNQSGKWLLVSRKKGERVVTWVKKYWRTIDVTYLTPESISICCEVFINETAP